MKTSHRNILVGVGIVTLILLGVLISTFGNVGIRRSVVEMGTLAVTNPLVPGVPFTASWAVDETKEDQSVLLKLRLAGGESELFAARYREGTVVATVPCSVTAGDGSLILVELLSGRTLAQEPVSVLSAAQDCLP